MFDGDYDKDMAMSDPKYIELQEKLKVMVHGSMRDEMRMIFTD